MKKKLLHLVFIGDKTDGCAFELCEKYFWEYFSIPSHRWWTNHL